MADAGEDVEKGEPSYTVGGNASWCSHSGKQYGDYPRYWKYNYPKNKQLHYYIFSKEYKQSDLKGHMHANVYSSYVHNSQTMEKA